MGHKSKSGFFFTATQAALPELNFSFRPLDESRKLSIRKRFQPVTLGRSEPGVVQWNRWFSDRQKSAGGLLIIADDRGRFFISGLFTRFVFFLTKPKSPLMFW